MEALVRIEAKLDTTRNISHGSIPGTNDLIDVLWTSSEVLDIESRLGMAPEPGHLDVGDAGAGLAEKILQSLEFDGMVSRRDGIVDAFPETFEWLFDPLTDSGVNDSASSSFIHWLESEMNEAFWITGKPASGKSTLMKFISNHRSLNVHLSRWAADHRLLVGAFYFWGPGTPIQKSLAGLLRSILHQLLSQRPELCEFVATRRQVLFSVAGSSTQSPPWGFAELRECLTRLAAKIQGETRLALFVDGLDEFDGNYSEVVSLLRHLQHNYGVKVCVSSRPWVVFSDFFKQNPLLRMEDLTKPDIDKYIIARFNHSVALGELVGLYPDSIKEMENLIRDRAEGVFLWVVIVVEQVLLTASETPTLAQIWAVFNSLPADLEALYERIHFDIDPAKMEITSKLYRLVLSWRQHWDAQARALPLWLAINWQPPAGDVQCPAFDSLDAIWPVLTRLLAGHTKGILQITPVGKDGRGGGIARTVDFLHRTAFDWAQLPDRRREIESQSPGFDPLVAYLAALSGQMRHQTFVARRRQYGFFDLYQLFRICARIDHLSASKDNLAAVFSQVTLLDTMWNGERLDILKLLSRRYLAYTQSKDTRISNCMDTLAASWCCRAYIRARCETIRNFLQSRPHILDAAVLGGLDGPSDEEVLLRLETVKFLLDNGASSSNLNMLKRAIRKDLKTIDQAARNATWGVIEAEIYIRKAYYMDAVLDLLARSCPPTGDKIRRFSTIHDHFTNLWPHNLKRIRQLIKGYSPDAENLEPLSDVIRVYAPE